MMFDETWRGMETRSYTDLQLERVRASVTTGNPDASGLDVVQASAGVWARGMAVAEIMPDTMVTRLITPGLLHDLGRSLVLYGEALWLIENRPSGLILNRAAYWDVWGAGNWNYRVTIPEPSGTRTRNVGADSVIHVRINADPAEPWRGRSPVALSSTTTTLAAEVESHLRDEASANHGYVIPAPLGGLSKADNAEIRSDLKNLRGNTAMVPAMESFGDGRPGSAPGNWQPQRIGMNPPQTVVVLRQQVGTGVLGVCGVPSELIAGRAEGTGRRESWRQFLHGTLQPVADILAAELAEKLEMPVTVSFDRLFASDVQGRARAFQSLVGGGVLPVAAGRATGVDLAPGDVQQEGDEGV